VQKKLVEEKRKAVQQELKQKKAIFKEEHQAEFIEHRTITAKTIRDTIKSSDLYWAHKEYLKQSFYQALKKGEPKFKSWFLKDVCFLHRYTGGGAPLDTLFRPNKKIYIEPIDWDRVDFTLPQRQWKKQVHTKVHVTVCGETMTFACVFHRRIPETAIVKQITVSGRWNGRNVIKWNMAITVEIPELPKFPLDDIWIEANYKENQLEKIKPGQKVIIRCKVWLGEAYNPPHRLSCSSPFL
jgi:hypothetical protein